MDPLDWWAEAQQLMRELDVAQTPVAGVGVSGMGPCLVVCDEHDRPLRPAILYGIDTRAVKEIRALNDEFGEPSILARGGSALSTQAVGPKLRWLEVNEPNNFRRARRLFMPSSWLVRKLTDEYVLDHHSASQCNPLYDLGAGEWYDPWASQIVGPIELPRLCWPSSVAGTVSRSAAESTGLKAGTPVIAGTIDAWAEAISGDAHNDRDCLLMYGSTMFLVVTSHERVIAPPFWGTAGALEGTFSLAGGMGAAGSITDWLRGICGSPTVEQLIAEASRSGPGANGLLLLPYFEGERTPISDPDANGLLIGLSTRTQRGDLYRAALEAVGFGVRHNLEAMASSGAVVDRVVGVGGGTTDLLWAQIVSDITGREQELPKYRIGASYGVAFLVAHALEAQQISKWNPVASVVVPSAKDSDLYDKRYALYRSLYGQSKTTMHALR